MLPLAVSKLSSAEKRERACNMLKRVGLPDRMLHLPQQLSGGEQERVAIARSLVNNPPLLLADEPTGSLDKGTGEQIMELLSTLHKDGLSVVMVTHEPEYARLTQRTVVIEDGLMV